MQCKLVFIDVDGTLTAPGKVVPPESAVDAIRRARELGHTMFLCSGRNYSMVEPLMQYGFDGAIASCGGYVFAGDEVLNDCPMTPEQQEKALRLFAEGGVVRTVETLNANYNDTGLLELLAENASENSEMGRWITATRDDFGVCPMEEYDGSPIYKIVFMCTDAEQLIPARTALEGEFDFLVHDYSEENCVFGEIVNRRFDKGRAVRLVAEKLGFDIADTIGFGDSLNDREMIETVGTSVCMENGSPKLKEISDLVCPAVDDDGIEWAFRKLGLI